MGTRYNSSISEAIVVAAGQLQSLKEWTQVYDILEELNDVLYDEGREFREIYEFLDEILSQMLD